jgi:hypothetical protein
LTQTHGSSVSPLVRHACPPRSSSSET